MEELESITLNLPYDGEIKAYDFNAGKEILRKVCKTASINKVGRKHARYYYNVVMSFDIETSKVENSKFIPKKMPESFHYFNYPFCWQCMIDDYYIIGNNITEFFDMITAACEWMDGYICCFIHNAAFEYGNLADYFNDGIIDPNTDGFFKNPSTPLYIRYRNHFEFRCNRQLTMKSLAKIGKDIEYEKLKGDWDYNIQRHPDTFKCSPEEENYRYRDVAIMNKFLKMERDNYCSRIGKQPNTCFLPLTATGYVRHDIKKEWSTKPSGYNILKSTALTEDEYRFLRPAFWGGFTHANFRKIGKECSNVEHGDLTSAYPRSFLNRFPYKLTKIDKPSYKVFYENIYNYSHIAQVASLHFTKISMNKGAIPYIPESKCLIKGIKIEENGKVVYADDLIIICCDVDAKIIIDNYNFSTCDVLELYNGLYENLPYGVVSIVVDYFMKKTIWKNVGGMEIDYQLAKAKLNSLFGMAGTSLLNSLFKVDPGTGDIESAGEEYKQASVLPFQWAIWITAYTRRTIYNLIEGMQKDGQNAMIYTDTDSIFYESSDKIRKLVNEYNRKNLEFLKEKQKLYYYLLPKSPDGVEQHLGEFLPEDVDKDGKSIIKSFCTIGAKRYYIEYPDGSYNVTFSGLRATKRKKLKDGNYVNGFNTQRLIDKYGSLHKAFLTIKDKFIELPYVEGVDKLSNYNIKGYEFTGYLCGIKVTRPCTYTLYPQSIRLSLNPSLKNFLGDVLYNEYE